MHKEIKYMREELLKKAESLDIEDRRILIVNLLAQQRRISGKEKDEFVREYCTLIDLSTGIVVGSGICPHCNGWIGRISDEDYL